MQTKRNRQSTTAVLSGDRPSSVYPELSKTILEINSYRLRNSYQLPFEALPEVQAVFFRLQRCIYGLNPADIIRSRKEPIGTNI